MVAREADAVVVGAGAAGSLIAHRLAAAGKSVVVLEQGPAWEQGDLVSSQLYARRLKWGGPPVRQDRPAGFGHNVATGWGLGGAATHHYATWPRFYEAAFEGWPFPYAALKPHYDRVEEEVGIAGDATLERWRPPADPYRLPPTPRTPQGDLLARGFEAIGLPVAPLPVAILSRDYKDRPACLYDGWCDAGCPIGALANPLVTHLMWATEAGARVHAGVTVTRVLPASAARAAGVEWIGPAGRGRVEAEHVVLAASAIGNPRLLLASAGGPWPAGPGNATGQVGRGFALDMLALVHARMDAPTEPHRGLSAGTLLNRAAFDRPGAPHGAWQWQIGHAMKPNDLFGVAMARADLFGPALADFMRGATRDMAGMGAMVGQPSRPENRVSLSPERDRLGQPLARVVHDFTAADRALWSWVQAEGLRAAKAAGAREAWGGPFAAGHLFGGTLMGDDPARSVADAHGRVHGLDNLWLAGSGLFPGGAGVSPTFTLLALADRAAQAMLGG